MNQPEQTIYKADSSFQGLVNRYSLMLLVSIVQLIVASILIFT